MAGRRLIVLVLLVITGTILSLYPQLGLPLPTGAYPVGRTSFSWSDDSRPEELTSSPGDSRVVVIQAWYPARPGSGTHSGYYPGLNRIASALVESGELSPIEVLGLRFVRSSVRQDAALPEGENHFPVILLSPGNATNVEFYAAQAEELASHGFIVLGINHPYDVAAVALPNGSIAQFASDQWPQGLADRNEFVRARIDVRVTDVRFVLDQLERLDIRPEGIFAKRLDLSKVGIMGHSLGGITAAQACQSDTRLSACLNLDGIQAGGPFAASSDPQLPTQPFMFITKEERLRPEVEVWFQELSAGGFRVTMSSAAHDSFTDGPILTPAILSLPTRADRITALVRQYTLAFFDQTIRGESSNLLAMDHRDEHSALVVYAPVHDLAARIQ